MRSFSLVWSVSALVVATLACNAADKAELDNRIQTEQGDLVVRPVQHATLVLEWNGKTIHVDPVGGAEAFAAFPKPDLILVTHIHSDHLDLPTLQALVPATSQVRIVASKAVAEKLSPPALVEKTTVLTYGGKTEAHGIGIEAVPAYNTTPQRQKFHAKGRDNGYLLRMGGTTVYIAGDTEDTPEMRKLKGVDLAFLPMNEPYTMTVRQAADAAREFKPKVVYPYHFRNQDGSKADLELFKKLVGTDSGVEVRIAQWYGK